MDIRWENPEVEAGGLRAKHREMTLFAEELRKNPGEWALLQEHTNYRKAVSQASNINSGNIAALVGAKAVSRKGKVYVHWPVDEEPPQDTTVSQDVLRDFISQLGHGWEPNELAEALRINFDIYPRAADS